MTNQRNAELIRTAVGAVRAPFAIADMQIVRFRGERSRVRVVPQTALVLIDVVLAKVLPDVAAGEAADAPRDDVRSEPLDTATPPAAEPEAPQTDDSDDVPLDEERQDQLDSDRKTREHKATRSNKSLSSIARDLAVAEAVADVHEDNARKEELTAKDFGPPSSS